MSSRIQKDTEAINMVPSSVVAAGPGAAEAAIAKKREDTTAAKQPSVGVSESQESKLFFLILSFAIANV